MVGSVGAGQRKSLVDAAIEYAGNQEKYLRQVGEVQSRIDQARAAEATAKATIERLTEWQTVKTPEMQRREAAVTIREQSCDGREKTIIEADRRQMGTEAALDSREKAHAGNVKAAIAAHKEREEELNARRDALDAREAAVRQSEEVAAADRSAAAMLKAEVEARLARIAAVAAGG